MRLEDIKESKEQLVLKKLPYESNGLEPYISEETIDYHYGKLAKGYVTRFNNNNGDKEFNRAGAYLHNVYFQQFKLHENSNDPFDEAKLFIKEHFKSYKDLKKKFKNAAMELQGSGWIYVSEKGNIETIHNHEMRDDIVILIDMWEHAFALDYKHDKKHYIDNFWKIINWDVINQRLI